MDLERYLGLPAGDAGGNGTHGAGDGGGERRTRVFETLRRRVFLVGTLVFAAVWFLVAKLRLLDAVSANVTLGAAAALLVASIVLVAGARRRAEGPLAAQALAPLRDGDVGAAIELAKRRLLAEPSRVERAEAESVLASCAALEGHLEEALLLAEMAAATAARAPFGTSSKRAIAARVAAVGALARGEAPPPPRADGEGDDPIAALVLTRAQQRATKDA